MRIVVFSEGMITLAAKLEVFVITGTFDVFKILVLQKGFPFFPAGGNGMMITPQTILTVFDKSVHLCFGKKRHFFEAITPATIRKIHILLRCNN